MTSIADAKSGRSAGRATCVIATDVDRPPATQDRAW